MATMTDCGPAARDLLSRLSAPVRNRYYYGKMLDAWHLELEQVYGNRKRWLVNRLSRAYDRQLKAIGRKAPRLRASHLRLKWLTAPTGNNPLCHPWHLTSFMNRFRRCSVRIF